MREHGRQISGECRNDLPSPRYRRLLSGLLQLLPNWCTKLTPGLEPQASVAKKNFIMTSLLDTCEPTPIGPKGFNTSWWSLFLQTSLPPPALCSLRSNQIFSSFHWKLYFFTMLLLRARVRGRYDKLGWYHKPDTFSADLPVLVTFSSVRLLSPGFPSSLCRFHLPSLPKCLTPGMGHNRCFMKF